MEKKYENLTVNFSDNIASNTMLFVKEDIGVFMAKVDEPITVFTSNERNVINAFWDCMNKNLFF